MAPPERATDLAPARSGRQARPEPRGGGLGTALRLIGALVLLGLGGTLGWQARGLVLQRPVPDDPAGQMLQRRQELLGSGWKEVDGGVFARPCDAPCRPPRIYGGGAAAAVEVDCLQRHCGSIAARFSLIDRGGAVLGERQIERQGRQGERLQLLAESDDPRVSRVELSALRARAVQDGS